MTPLAPHILVVDDDADQRELLRIWLERSGFQLTLASGGPEALQAFERGKFDAVITDLAMPGIDGLQLLTILKAIDPAVQVIFLTGAGTLDDAVGALRQGRAYDFLIKPLRDLRQLNLSIEGAMSQHRAALEAAAAPARTWALPAWRTPEPAAIAPAAAPMMAMTIPKAAPAPVALPDHVEALTRNELNIMFLLAQGFDNRAIAEQLHYSEKTIRNYLSRVYEKLSVGNRLQAVAFCRRHGLIEDAETTQLAQATPVAS